MRKRIRAARLNAGVRTTAIAMFLVLNCTAGAQQTLDDRDAAAIQVLAKHFVDAVNNRSESGLKELLHPASRDCVRAQNASWFDGIFSRRMTFVIPSDYVVRAQPRSPEYFSPPEAVAAYPVRPTHTLQIEFHIQSLSSTSIQLSIVKNGSSWYEVLPCPSAEDMKRLQATEQESAAYDQRVKRIIANLAEPLRGDLETLLRNGQRGTAIRKYQEASGEDIAIATSVIEKLLSKN
jgi:hypothetical protein